MTYVTVAKVLACLRMTLLVFLLLSKFSIGKMEHSIASRWKDAPLGDKHLPRIAHLWHLGMFVFSVLSVGALERI
jgi:hypothetical protein